MRGNKRDKREEIRDKKYRVKIKDGDILFPTALVQDTKCFSFYL